MYSGRFSEVAIWVTTLMAPWINRAAPLPPTVLPGMNTGEREAAAQKADLAAVGFSMSPFAAGIPLNTTIALRCTDFWIKKLVYRPSSRPESCDSNQAYRAILTNIAEGVELDQYLGDGYRNNGYINGHQGDGWEKRAQNDGESWSCCVNMISFRLLGRCIELLELFSAPERSGN